jgi:hypothetical protein
MKFIREKDNKWHNPKEELPPITTDVEFIDLSNNVRNGEIVVEMSGFYLYIRGEGWDSMDNIKQWRFV